MKSSGKNIEKCFTEVVLKHGGIIRHGLPKVKARWQQTFNNNGHKITVVIKRRTNVGNFIGYSALVTDNKGHELRIPMINKLYQNEAQDIAYTRFVQQYC